MGTYFLFFLNEEEIKKKLSFGEGKKRSSHLTPSFSLSLSLSLAVFSPFQKKRGRNLTPREKKKSQKIWNMSRLVWFVKREHHHSNYTQFEIYSRWIDYDRGCSLFQPECIHTSPFILLSFFSFCVFFFFFFFQTTRRRKERVEEKDPPLFSLSCLLSSSFSLSLFFSFFQKKRERERESTNREVLPSLSSVKPHA